MTEIYVSDAIHPDVLATIGESARVHLGWGDDAVDYARVAPAVDAVILRAETFSRAVIEASPNLRIIARHGVGTDNVDLHAAAEHCVWVTTTPGANSNAVAEYVFALLLSAARKVPQAMERVRGERWSEGKSDLVGFELGGRTIGVLGFGSIGRAVTRIATGFRMRVLAYDPAVEPADIAGAGAGPVELRELLAASDVVTVHVPLLPSTRNLLGADEIARMKPGSILVNTSRGGLVDENALADALRSGRLGGAVLDVLEAEAADMKDPLRHNALPLGTTPALGVTPHVAGQTTEAFRQAGHMAWEAVQAALADRTPPHAVQPRGGRMAAEA
ncbi:phosphoglycerate dehydrogenase-like enzyme [Spinactinospora alkalitolerans]|uniref:Phosphoglycerate dehydrogenase-like enzyme n=1 Tax=Spinactinospora alkalitolerans TaxID=687207 RepID=A0A852TXH0_9ACTN|nr:hydroxyacid dehydrogenase [Spinactinospora alkalitolerans]NYE47987.1 phosphoglycerate dehydrogenase-like enzyme [Spinactinospora alkalitolerans]